jgi:hypothetical protein
MMTMCPPQHGHSRQEGVWLGWYIGECRRRDPEQLADVVELGPAAGAGEHAVMADAVKALWADVEQEAADELVPAEGHDLLLAGACTAVIPAAEGDADLVEARETAVRDSGPVHVARQIGQHRVGAGEGGLA